MTCFENVMLAVERVFGRKEGRAKLKERVDAALDLVHMTHAAHKRPHEISGGMKRRVGIARAFAMEARILPMDEPLGALDALTRASLQDELNGVIERTGATVAMVTHDVDEAVLLSDRIVMMTNGPTATIGEILGVELARPRATGAGRRIRRLPRGAVRVPVSQAVEEGGVACDRSALTRQPSRQRRVLQAA